MSPVHFQIISEYYFSVDCNIMSEAISTGLVSGYCALLAVLVQMVIQFIRQPLNFDPWPCRITPIWLQTILNDSSRTSLSWLQRKICIMTALN